MENYKQAHKNFP